MTATWGLFYFRSLSRDQRRRRPTAPVVCKGGWQPQVSGHCCRGEDFRRESVAAEEWGGRQWGGVGHHGEEVPASNGWLRKGGVAAAKGEAAAQGKKKSQRGDRHRNGATGVRVVAAAAGVWSQPQAADGRGVAAAARG